MALTVLTKAINYPVTLEEAKEHLRVTDTNSDSYIQGLIAAVCDQVESQTGRTLITTEYLWKMDAFTLFNYSLYVPKSPLQNVSAITYIDTNTSTQTWGSTYYTVDIYSLPGRITPAYLQIWPITLYLPNAITIQFTAGHSSHLGGIPESLKHGLKFLISHYWANRQETVISEGRVMLVDTPKASDYLLAKYQIPFFEGY